MALPQDFWQNEHMFHRFRSKPCQRLLRSGICEWHSQCQFSHDPEWPRRSPSKYDYSPAMCPHLQPVMMNSGEVRLENTCPSGLSCTFSHTKDEVLYHPSIFKTSLCEEHRSLTNDQRSARRSKHRPRCHRYYCPFAHGKLELRTSPMSPEQRDAFVRAIGIFPNAVCCGMCTHNALGPANGIGNCMENSGMGYGGAAMPMGQEAIAPSQMWSGSVQNMFSQMAISGGAADTGSADLNEGHVWGTSQWLQQPLQSQQAPWAQRVDSRLQDVVQTSVQARERKFIKEQMENLNALNVKEQTYCVQVEKSQQDAQDAEDGDLDIDSEIIGRAVRFIEELSTEESDSDAVASPVDKKDIQYQQSIKESGFSNGAYRTMWNPQEAEPWVAEMNTQNQWQDATNCWSMRTVNRL